MRRLRARPSDSWGSLSWGCRSCWISMGFGLGEGERQLKIFFFSGPLHHCEVFHRRPGREEWVPTWLTTGTLPSLLRCSLPRSPRTMLVPLGGLKEPHHFRVAVSSCKIQGRPAAQSPGVHPGPRRQQHPAHLRVAEERRDVQRGGAAVAVRLGHGAGHRPQQVPHRAEAASLGRHDDVVAALLSFSFISFSLGCIFLCKSCC
mmetsp:Transcript_67731/g.106531  ORF Transcript_67731/g.106531 Transcript_67731/m.106531 type:complete len:203 (-) Transcript_67731:1098-1706(-)